MNWNFNNIPNYERKTAKLLYDNGQYELLLDMIKKYEVAKLECESCGTRKTVFEWFGYLFREYKDWINGVDCKL